MLEKEAGIRALAAVTFDVSSKSNETTLSKRITESGLYF